MNRQYTTRSTSQSTQREMHHVLRNILALRANSEIERYVQQESVQTVTQLLTTPRKRLYDQGIQIEDGYTLWIPDEHLDRLQYLSWFASIRSHPPDEITDWTQVTRQEFLDFVDAHPDLPTLVPTPVSKGPTYYGSPYSTNSYSTFGTGSSTPTTTTFDSSQGSPYGYPVYNTSRHIPMYPSTNQPYTPTVNVAETSVSQTRVTFGLDSQPVSTSSTPDIDEFINDDTPELEVVHHDTNHDEDPFTPRETSTGHDDSYDSDDDENLPPLVPPEEAPTATSTIFFRSPRPGTILRDNGTNIHVPTPTGTFERDDDTSISDTSTISTVDTHTHGPFPMGRAYTYCDDTLYIIEDAAYVGPSPPTIPYGDNVYHDIDTSPSRSQFRADQHCFELIESTLSMIRQTFRQPSPYYLGDTPPSDEIPEDYSHALQLDYFTNSDRCRRAIVEGLLELVPYGDLQAALTAVQDGTLTLDFERSSTGQLFVRPRMTHLSVDSNHVIPRTFQEALAIDDHNNNHLWQNAIYDELARTQCSFQQLTEDSVHLLFRLKHNGKHSARLVQGPTSFSFVDCLAQPPSGTIASAVNAADDTLPTTPHPSSSHSISSAQPSLATADGESLTTEEGTMDSQSLKPLILMGDKEDRPFLKLKPDKSKYYASTAESAPPFPDYGELSRRKVLTIEIPHNFERAQAIDNINQCSLWEDAVRREDDHRRSDRVPSIPMPTRVILRLINLYQQMFGELPPLIDLLTYDSDVPAGFDRTTPCNASEIRKFKEILAHIQSITYLGQQDLHKVIHHLTSSKMKPKLIHLQQAKNVIRFVATFPQSVRIQWEPGNTKQRLTRAQKRRLHRTGRSSRIINEVMSRATENQNMVEQWTQWGHYVLTSEVSPNLLRIETESTSTTSTSTMDSDPYCGSD